MDSESLDRCIQTTLSALFPPFQDTSPTVLCQVLSVVERCYRGDGLRYLLHFLLPAKQFLQSLQQDACLPYCGLLFRHEGWPLCLHEKVVIQLCHLDQRLIRPGDFYLLVSPSSFSSSSSSSSSRHSASRQGPPTPRLLLCSVSTGSRHVEEQEIPELALSSLFTMAWLDSVNREREQRGVSRIERALLSAHGDVFRVPWEDIVYPQFINRPRAPLKEGSVKDGSINASSGQDKTQEGTVLCSSGHSLAQNPTPLPCPIDQSAPSSEDSDSEGEYVELSEMPLPRFSPQKGSLTQLISQQHKARTSSQSSDKNKSPNVPTEFQSTQKHSPAASKDALSSCTEETCNISKPIEEKDSAVAINGPVILTPIAQPTTGEMPQCAEQQTEGRDASKSFDLRPSRQDYKEVIENMDLIDFDGDVLEHVVLIKERKDVGSGSQSVEEEQEGESIAPNSLEGGEVALQVEVIEQQEIFETKDQESGLKEQNEDLNLGELLCTDLQDTYIENVQITENSLDALSELNDLDRTHFGETNTEKPDINTESTYLETGDAQKEDNEKVESKHSQKEHCENAVETLENHELSLDAYIDDQLQKHSEMLHTRVIYLEATDAGYFELFHSQDANIVDKKEDFGETAMQCSDTGGMQDVLNDKEHQSIPDTDICEVAEQDHSVVEVQSPCLDAQFENAQNTQVETAEIEHEDTVVDLVIDHTEQIESQDKTLVDTEETIVDLSIEEKKTQTNHCNLEMDQEKNNEKDMFSDKCKQIQLECSTQVSEEPKTLAVPSTTEILQDPSSVKDLQKNNTEFSDNKKDGQTETVHSDSVSKPQGESIEMPEVAEAQATVPGFAASNPQDDLEIRRLISEMVDSVEGVKKMRSRRRVKRKSMQYLNTSVVAMEQQIDMLETEFKHLQSKIKQMEHIKLDERQNCTEDNHKVATEEAATCCEVVEQKDDVKTANLEENMEKVAHPQEVVDSRHRNLDLPAQREIELAQPEEFKVQDSNNNGSMQNTDEDLQMEEMHEPHEEQDPKSPGKAETIDISGQLDVQVTNSHRDPVPSIDTGTPCLDSLSSNENHATEKAKPECLLSNSEIIPVKIENEVTQPGICESRKTQETEVEETEKPVNSVLENGPHKGDLKVIDKVDQKIANAESHKCQNGQLEMPKVLRTNPHKPGPNAKIGEAKHVFEPRKGHYLIKVPTEGSNSLHLSNGSVPKALENLLSSRHANHSLPLQLSKSPRSRFNKVLLSSGVLCLPGTRDKSGRALVTVNARSTVWSSPDCDSAELLQVLLYYSSTLRKEVQALGLTVLVDVRRAPPVPVLFTALRSLQESTPGSVHAVLLLLNKDSPVRLDKPPFLQVEMVHSMKSLQKHVDLRQLPVECGGSFNFCQSSWLCYRTRVENLTNQCNNVISLLQKTIHVLESTALPSDAQNAEQLLSKYKAVMCSILQDSRLVQLQQEGGASLSRLRRDESSICATEDYRAAVEAVSSLYDQVDEMLHRLVTLSNAKTQELHFILEFTGLESGFTEVRSWLQEVGEARLKSLDEPEDSLELLLKNQQDFKDFCTTANDWCGKGQGLLKRLEHWDSISSAELQAYEVKVHDFWAQLQDFSQRVTTTGQNIDRAVHLYSFLDQAYGWALAGMRHLAGVSMEDCTLPDKCPAVISCLEEYNRLHPPISDPRFQEMRALAGELRGERGLRQWSFAWAKCQETKKMFDRKMEAALRTRDSAQRRRSDSEQSKSSSGFSRKSLSGLWSSKESAPVSPNHDDDAHSTCSSSTPSPPRNSNATPITSTPQHTPLLQRLFRSPTSLDDTKGSVEIPPSPAPSLSSCSFTSSFTSPSLCSSSFTPMSRRQHLRKTQSFDCPPTPEPSRYGASPRTLSEPARRGNIGVFIKGLEVSSTEAADRTLCPRTGAQSWAGPASRSPSTQSINSVSSAAEQRPRGSKLRHIVEEMVTTEREYVRSLRYIIHHYFPEMERLDVPQDLRGKRSVVFGNLEKLLDFHSQFFLKELEACWKHPLRVPHCFLRHQEQFGLYALYSKNKPKSDALLAHHGNSFFRRKQVELGDKMDLSSYLLKPIQRMSKYALLLSDLIKEVGASQSQEAELANLHAATNMVKFQLRHGNDLLAMDAIRDCDVNLKEQGQLIRQDEFTVWSGRRKCQRHVFLFEDLVLFSKPKRMEGGLDVYIYKHSFKAADVGLTESTGDDGLRFEIWFRRRTSKNQTFLLQASSAEVKQSWTSDIARLLWTQATRNKEMRLKEMVSMGVGNKPFLDIQPSDAAISDRAVHYIMKSRGARTRASIAVSVFDHSNPYKRSVTSDPSAASGPSSCSLLGPLNLHMFSQTMPPAGAAEGSFINSCIEEDEQEHETSSQPSMTTESSGSSSRCLSGSTGSDSGCVSSHLQEALQEEPNPSQASSSSSSSSSNPTPPNKQHLSSPFISANAGSVISPATIV